MAENALSTVIPKNLTRIPTEIVVETRMASQQLQQEAKRTEKTLGSLFQTLKKDLAPAATMFSGVGKAVNSGLRLPLTLARGAAKQLASGFNSLFGGQIRQAIQQLGSSIMAAFTATERWRTAASHLQTGFSQMIKPIVQAVTPALVGLTNTLATLLAYLGRLFQLLTGKSIKSAQAVADVGAAAETTAKQTQKAARSLAGFDEINRLDAPKSSGAGGGAASPGTATQWQAQSPFLDQLLAAVQKGDYGQVGALIAEKLKAALEAIPWEGIQAAARRWALNLTNTLNGFMTAPEVWAAMGAALGESLDTALLFMSTALQNFNWKALGSGLAALLNNACAAISWDQLGAGISALATGLLEALSSFLLQTDWSAVGQGIGTALAHIDWLAVLAGVAVAVGAALESLFELNFPIALLGTFTTAILGVGTAVSTWNDFSPIIREIKDVFIKGLSATNLTVLGVAAGITALIAVGVLLYENWDTICDAAAKAGQSIRNAWQGLCNWFTGVFVPSIQNALNTFVGWVGNMGQAAVNLFTAAWSAVTGWFSANIIGPLVALWQGFAATVGAIWSGINAGIRLAVNGVIALINNLVAGVIWCVNAMVSGLNQIHFSIPSWVPGLGGRSFGFALSAIATPQIPYLAQGAVIPANREFLAVLGDQTHGTNVEAPLAVIEEAVANVLDTQLDALMAGFEAVVAVDREILQAVLGIQIGDDVIGRANARYQQRRAVMRGGSW